MSNIIYENENNVKQDLVIITLDSVNLDFMRAIAVMLVLTDHLLEMQGYLHNVSFHPYDWYLGRMGVLLFFVHTSLVLMLSMDRTRLSGKYLVGHFYIRRAFRLYPLSIFCVISALALSVPQSAWRASESSWSTTTIFANLLLTQNLTYSPSIVAPLWSLPLELQMYFILPFLYLILTKRQSAKFLLSIIVMSIILANIQPLVSDRLNIAQFIPCFLGGIVAWFVTKRGVDRSLPWIAWPIFLIIILSMYVFIESLDPDMHPPWLGWLMCLVVGLCIIKFKEIPKGMLADLAAIIARYSYGIYLFHMFAIWFGFHMFSENNEAIRWIIFLSIIIIVPYFT